MKSSRAVPASVDEYIQGFAPDVQAILRRVRRVIREAAPDAQEVISYRMPALKQNGIQPIPYELIGRITALRVKQDAAKSKRRRT